MKKILLILYLFLIFSGCGTFLKSTDPAPELSPKLSPVKKSILEKLSFLPFIKLKTPTESSPAKIELLQKLGEYERIVDDHVAFDNKDKKGEDDTQNRNGKKNSTGSLKKKEEKETIEEKIAEIKIIRGLTARYETWSLQWNEKTDLVGNDLSLIEINEIQKELKRISKKL